MAKRKLAYNVDEAAEVLGMSTWSVRRAVERGEIPTLPFAGRRVLIPRKPLERIVAGFPPYPQPVEVLFEDLLHEVKACEDHFRSLRSSMREERRRADGL